MKNIVENNKLIAEFMGLSYCKKYLYEGWYKNHEHNHRLCDFNGLKYHSDWNWLMEVVEKIERLGYVFEIKITGCRINQIENGSIIVLRWEEDKTKIEAVYNACLEFIKWYNEQNK